ncbi:NAD(P)-dependent dehydrogenase (short-subunit alcohol dehydrogenase family) [Lysinibacillus composti]|uniref:SDR family oxidoreductase n=1 Tax=Lysinibacillus composti TaxID=720633 RepID=A0A3N9UME8_9BACI|nr:SDR family oxidoreductase [Lysinibacillus composti]MBM7610225.1 NAD(P)-dependent dehydrogenase (short-subunit alcohol dehydrogenase family) [Lysinibacillus composti]RQW73692.1 SDR family oxidoreductase [Lysinibacillus composti]
MIPVHGNLRGRVAVITGGSGVLCSEMARELARQGMKVAIINLNKDKGQKVVDSIVSSGGEAMAISANVLEKQSLIAAREEILTQFGGVDLLINGAGGNHPDAITAPEESVQEVEGKSFFDLEERGFTNVFSLNFTGTFLACQVFGQELLKAQAPSIINISSMSGLTPLTKIPAYSAAKASINNFTEWLAVHFAQAGLRVNAIAPGFFITTQNKDLLVDEKGEYTNRSKKILAATPMKKFGEPEQLLGALLFLADEAYSSFVTGTTIPVDGGFNAYSGV